MNPFVFLIDILLQLYATALLIRVILQWVRADFYNPVSQFIVKITNPPVKPLRKIIPGFWGIDIATLLLAAFVIAFKTAVVHSTLAIDFIILKTIIESIDLILNIFLYAIIIQAILSWVNPDPYNPVVQLLHNLTHPVLKHFRKLLPPISGFDLSPIFAIIAILFVQQTIHYLIRMVFGG
ncbi:MAG: YggT family protein [Gammaproteobacteria bacterium]|nr:YggT family protein [Gammaproteobacteria bacterium]